MESQAPRTRAPSAPVALPDPSVFDLEAYAAHYTDRRKVQRLLFVARSCPALAMDAFALAIATLEQTSLDVQLYEQAVQEHNAALEGLQRELASSSKPSQAALNAADRKAIPLNQAWVKATRDKAEREQDKLEVELKSYQSNVIKESIRVGGGAFLPPTV
jgi:COP9 signalosome complex subunit 1